MPEPLCEAWRLRQAGALAWLASRRGGRADGCVGFAGGDDGDAAGGEQGTETDAEGEGVCFSGWLSPDSL